MNGSLVNRLMSAAGQPEPKVGDGATICFYSDRRPATVVRVRHFKSGSRAGQVSAVDVQDDAWKVVRGHEGDGSAEYEYESDPAGHVRTFRPNKNGRYVGAGVTLALGRRERYWDPHL